jgi:hypothetical protein
MTSRKERNSTFVGTFAGRAQNALSNAGAARPVQIRRKDFWFHAFLASPVFVSEQPFALANT